LNPSSIALRHLLPLGEKGGLEGMVGFSFLMRGAGGVLLNPSSVALRHLLPLGEKGGLEGMVGFSFLMQVLGGLY
jgi:hypothetical protein